MRVPPPDLQIRRLMYDLSGLLVACQLQYIIMPLLLVSGTEEGEGRVGYCSSCVLEVLLDRVRVTMRRCEAET